MDFYYWDDTFDGFKYKFMEIINDLKYYDDCIKRGFDDIKKTIEDIGRKQFNSDNLFFKKQLTETQMKLDILLFKIDITNIILK